MKAIVNGKIILKDRIVEDAVLLYSDVIEGIVPCDSVPEGVEVIDAKGGYTDARKKILLCAVPTREYFLTKEGIKKLDPDAFVIAIDTYEIQGRE